MIGCGAEIAGVSRIVSSLQSLRPVRKNILNSALGLDCNKTGKNLRRLQLWDDEGGACGMSLQDLGFRVQGLVWDDV